MGKSNYDIEKLLHQMTLDEKIGQLVQLQVNMIGASKAEATGPAKEMGISGERIPTLGSVLNFQGAQEMIQVQDNHMRDDRNHIPLLFMMDVIHGCKTIYPIPLALGATFNPEIVAKCSAMGAIEASACGVQVTFAPMIDYVRDARWGRVMETCGEDPYLNSVMGAAQIRAIQGDDLSDSSHIATCVKHFAAYGGAEAGRDYNTVEISERLLREYYLPAYKAGVDAGAKMVMSSFNSLNGTPAVANKWLLNDVLRKEWGFSGIIISDYNALGELITHGVAADIKEAASLAMKAGCDIDMMSPAYSNYLKELIEENVISESALDDAVFRILALKKELGLFEDPYHGASVEKENAVCLTAENRELVKKTAEESAVLLKNTGLLPLDKNVKKVALIGPFAATHKLNGSWSCYGSEKDTVSVEQGIRNLLPNAEITVAEGCSAYWNEHDCSGMETAIQVAKDADICILCIGEPQNYSGESASRADIGLPGLQSELVKGVLAANSNTVAVVFGGRPLDLTELDKSVPAILYMWFPGTEAGSAVAELLFGDANPSGKVPMSFPKAVGQCPIYYNHPSTGRPKRTAEDVFQCYASNYIGCGNLPLYPFGYGLSYTHFSYESLKLDRSEMTKDQKIKVSICVKNDGNVCGKETVQLYLHDLVASTVRPVQSLIAFEKIELQPGESKTVEFTVTEPMLRFYDSDCRFISEKGEFTLSTGYADHLILTQKFNLK